MPKVLWVAVLALLVPCQTGSAFLRIDPEYTCVYSDYRTDLMKHFGAVSSSSQSDFLSVHTPQLQVTQKMLGSKIVKVKKTLGLQFKPPKAHELCVRWCGSLDLPPRVDKAAEVRP